MGIFESIIESIVPSHGTPYWIAAGVFGVIMLIIAVYFDEMNWEPWFRNDCETVPCRLFIKLVAVILLAMYWPPTLFALVLLVVVVILENKLLKFGWVSLHRKGIFYDRERERTRGR